MTAIEKEKRTMTILEKDKYTEMIAKIDNLADRLDNADTDFKSLPDDLDTVMFALAQTQALLSILLKEEEA